MVPESPQRPLLQVPVAGGPPSAAPSPSRHETVLREQPAEARTALAEALAAADPAARRQALLAVAAEHPALLAAWARLSELTLSGGEPVVAYAFARVAYHRGLDSLRREGWGGTGLVQWARPSNRGFLRGLHALLASAAAIGEQEEATRCRGFLLELDPDDGLGVAGYPHAPGPGWTPPALPETDTGVR